MKYYQYTEKSSKTLFLLHLPIEVTYQ